jgi:hypothetical protein
VFWVFGRNCTIVSDGHESAVIDDHDDKQKEYRKREETRPVFHSRGVVCVCIVVGMKCKEGYEEECEELEAGCDAVCEEALHTYADLACNVHTEDDCAHSLLFTI